MEGIDLEHIDPDNVPEGVFVFRKGDDLNDALDKLLLQPGGYDLLLWLTARIVTTRSIHEWLEGFEDTVEQNPQLAQMVHLFFGLMVHLGNEAEDHDRFPIVQKAVQRRIAAGLYQELEKEKRQIRLLRIQPRAEDEVRSHKLLECSLETRSLDDGNLKFDALSYVWGDATQLVPILVDRKLFLATPNLVRALYSFQENNTVPGLLWVDAVCINQQDVEERNHQVTLMAQLYAQADEVRIWMGPESKHTAPLFDKLEDCGGSQDRPDSSIGNAVHLVDVESGCLDGLLDLLGRPWWSRVWVIQEAALARNPVIHCGSQNFEFRRLGEILQFFTTWMASEFDRGSPIYRAVSNSGMAEIQQLSMLLDILGPEHADSAQPSSSSHSIANPVNLIDATKHCSCTVQHDRVYSLLGLLPRTIGIEPSYQDTVEEVFEPAALSILKWSKSLDILQITGLTENRKLDIPSWVPELGNTVDAFFLYRAVAQFKADLGATCFINQDHKGEIRVRALLYDEVRVSSGPLNEVCQFPRR